MIVKDHLLHWVIPEMLMPGLRDDAQMKCLGLGSKIRPTYTKDQLFEDQLIGVICTMVGVKALTGSNALYYQHMEETGDKWEGDGGTDIPGARVDFKGSLMRYGNDPLAYNLLVRPKEFHERTLYVLIVVSSYDEVGADGYVVGCMESWEIEEKNQPDKKRFGDAFRIPAELLHPFPNARWVK